MGDIAIRVENLSKQYMIGLGKPDHDTLRDQLAGGLKSLFCNNNRHPQNADKIWALKNVSFEVGRGEAIGIIGHNGAGKSTLLKVLTRITKPTEGRAEIYGRVGSLLEVGTGFHPELTGRENIYLNGVVLGMSRTEINRQFDEIVDFSGVEKLLDTPIKRYSTGMKVRLAFSVAAHLEPEILMIDEVLAVGDVAFQKKCLGKMGDVAKQGRTVIFVSHNMAAITSLTRRAIWLAGGKVAAIGLPHEVIEWYIKDISSNSNQSGFLSLRSLPRPQGILANHRATLEWVRSTGRDGNQKHVFAEGEPIIVELGFKIHGELANLEFGIGVKRLGHGDTELFLVPSPTYTFSSSYGHYRIRMNMDPSYLRPGSYSLVLKMFADGLRQETLADTLQFRVTEDNSPSAHDQYRVWLSGSLKFDYEWGGVEPCPLHDSTE